jgi:hypothetical protein
MQALSLITGYASSSNYIANLPASYKAKPWQCYGQKGLSWLKTIAIPN